MTERTITTNGIDLHVVEAGTGFPVVLAHGFPELAYSWRHQLPALAAAGYHAIAPDMRGYGRTSRPDVLEDYDIIHLTDDLVGILDDLGHERAVFVGHDWGSMVVWTLALRHPERVAGVVGMSVPFVPRAPVPTMQLLRQLFQGVFFYMVYFQQPGVADADLGRDPATTMRRLLASTRSEPGAVPDATAMADDGRGFVDRIPEPDGLPAWLTEAELGHYVAEFTRTGFTGGLNWYRNLDRNWELTADLDGATVQVPSLFIGGTHDPVLTMSPPAAMDEHVTDHRGTVLVEGAGHWVQQESPAEVNAALLDFLAGLDLPADVAGGAVMRSVVLRQGQLLVRDDVAEPQPATGQVLVDVKACGICGSDLHFVKHGAAMREVGARMEGVPDMGRTPADLDQDVFMGHEFSGEVVELGPDTEGPAVGTIVTSVPIMLTATGMQDLAYTNLLPCGYSERMLLSAPLLQTVPNGLDPRHAALTEPMAVGLHAVNKAGLTEGAGALVLGCGPVGLAVIAALRLRGVEAIVASDFSPARRALAATMGAHEVVDPAVEPAFEAWRRVGGARSLVVFEAVGVPGMIDEVLRVAPTGSRVVVVGVCMQPDSITPIYGISKELNVQFVLGYDLEEFAGSLRAIAEGDIDVTPLITDEVALADVPDAFARLADPDQQCKILVVPGA